MRRAGGRATWVAVVAVLVVGVAAWLVWPSTPAVRAQNQMITVVDGPRDDQRVTLDTSFFPPAGGGKAPAVLLAHGFGGSKQSVRAEAVRLAGEGYAVLTWSARGFGRSTGQIALNSPDYEVKDVRQLVDWVARRPEVLLDAAGDPRVGVAGGSYGGAIALMSAAHDSRIDAIVPQITWYDLADALFPDATGRGPENGVFKRMWAGLFFSRGGPTPDASALAGLGARSARDTGDAGDAGDTGDGESPARPAVNPPTPQEVRCGRFLPEICDMYQQVAEEGRASAAAVETLRRSSPISVPGKIRVPTLLLQGQRDSLFPLGHADANARAIAATGAPVEVAWFDGGHDGGNGEVDWLHEKTLGWFDRHLKKDSGAAQPAGVFTVTRDGGRDPGTRRPVQLHAIAPAYAGLSGTDRTSVPLSGPDQPVANPPGGSPSSISAVPGFGGLGANLNLSVDMAGQSAAFDSAPLTAPLQVTGSSTVKVRVTAEAAGTGTTEKESTGDIETTEKDAGSGENTTDNADTGNTTDTADTGNTETDGASRAAGEVTLFAKLYDVAGDTQAPILPEGLVAPARIALSADGTGEATVTLPAVDHRFDVGHRLRVAFTTTDLGYSTPSAPAVYTVGLASPAVTVPVYTTLRTPSTGPVWWTWALPLLSIAVAIAVALTGRRRAADEHDPALESVPLRISGLTKAYRNGERAVDDLSFTVEHGQVLGLLGPNGAGKTTTLRMMMGLIHPDGGEIRIFGHRVVPGAPVLSRLGSFVEGPGFLPHLNGRDNLELYWKATGRPAGDAHFDEALEIAGLGNALERAVRTYSQGMRQRLAIAQAMLGLPDLLVLDEPTNGLDPPQIREMREVLIRYAARGRTVIVSSHLLAEVEQTCSHVVVMRRGRLVTAGPVSELLEGGAAAGGSSTRLEDVFLDLIGDKA
ncbi:ABC-2 type transport system ATP-binding protein [Streptosporangium becharense]|uniref:ABC-2 type transport system ATP-binding protein n=1 Tax=Streptosporangium becharense TaxID=1816182 RepID=A0A7W9ILH4_9ACTN|nr:CocE/NonD family hydrolase [Streptosporangium becharense]MBB2913326.1 ABC-2 type transport system ATP-binding protein [Streptosporangium becharense]MBB5822309.1 ABC-2 type transport system ATP-binding protein [Streptosporangium becharense]